MTIAKITVSGVKALAVESRKIPAGIIGATVEFEFTDPQWDGLIKTAVFRGCVTRAVPIEGNTVVVPQEVVAEAAELPEKRIRLKIGVYGVDEKAILAIPTLWATAGFIWPAADPSSDPAADSSLPIWAKLQQQLHEAGGSGISGGYYTPSITQPDSSTLTFCFTPSKASMPAVPAARVTLPVSGGGAGLSAAAAALLMEILEAAQYHTNISGKIVRLKEALASGGSSGDDTGSETPDEPDEPIEPDEPAATDDVTVSDGVMTIVTVGSAITVSDGVMTIA